MNFLSGILVKKLCVKHDGASIMAGEKNGMQSIIQNIYPMAIFIHYYAHQLNLVLLHGAKTIKDVKLFIENLTIFKFFSGSSKRSVLLREQGSKLPNQRNTRWNYHSRAAVTINTHFNELKNAESHVVDDSDWDSTSVCTTSDILSNVNKRKFVYLFVLFSKIFIFTDHTFCILQNKSTTDIKYCVNKIKSLTSRIKDLRNETSIHDIIKFSVELNTDLKYTNEEGSNLRRITFEIIDSLIVQINIRFKDFKKLKFVEIINEKMFESYKVHFPEEKLRQLFKYYPDIFNKDRLRNELYIIYADPLKYFTPLEFIDYIFKSKNLKNFLNIVTNFSNKL
jgi:hypothetical protein